MPKTGSVLLMTIQDMNSVIKFNQYFELLLVNILDCGFIIKQVPVQIFAYYDNCILIS
jgi:hypothetical protein